MMKTRTDSNKTACSEPLPETPERKLTFFRLLLGAAFCFYLVSVFYLVLGARWLHGNNSYFHRTVTGVPYWTQVKRHIQPVPFRTILRYIHRLPASNPLRRTAFVNLAGNLALFFPMGIFLPCFRQKQRKLLRFSCTVIFMIILTEITQVLTLLGACDIDDLILNYAGAVCGFLCFQLFDLIRRKIYDKSRRKL